MTASPLDTAAIRADTATWSAALWRHAKVVTDLCAALDAALDVAAELAFAVCEREADVDDLVDSVDRLRAQLTALQAETKSEHTCDAERVAQWRERCESAETQLDVEHAAAGVPRSGWGR